MAPIKFLVRRDLKHGLVVTINEHDEQDAPYAAVATIYSPRGHMIIMMKQDGQFVVDIHPDGGGSVEVVGVMNLFAAVVQRVNDVTINEPSKEKMN